MKATHTRIQILTAAAAVAAALLTGCSRANTGLKAGDLLFQPSSPTEFSKAISAATQGDNADFVHVGIFAVVDGDSVVIEASSAKGVTLTPLADFLHEADDSDGVTAVVAMRYPDAKAARRAVERALSLNGLPYDWEYTAANGAVYCSELVQYSYTDDRGKYIFESIPMNFADESGEYPKFWTELFDRLGKPIPQGAPGTNPNSIYAHPALHRVEIKR